MKLISLIALLVILMAIVYSSFVMGGDKAAGERRREPLPEKKTSTMNPVDTADVNSTRNLNETEAIAESAKSNLATFLDDFWPNSAWFLIETIITIFVIDRVIKYNEDRRWRPARSLLLSHLLKISDNLLLWIVPSEFRILAPKDLTFPGETKGRITLQVLNVEPSVLRERLASEALTRSEISAGPLGEAVRQLEYVKQYSGLLMEPPLFNLVLRLDGSISALQAWQKDRADDEDWRNGYAALAKPLIETASDLSKWVAAQAGAIVAQDDKTKGASELA